MCIKFCLIIVDYFLLADDIQSFNLVVITFYLNSIVNDLLKLLLLSQSFTGFTVNRTLSNRIIYIDGRNMGIFPLFAA